MITLDDFLFNLYRQTKISGEVCLERAQERVEMQKKMLSMASEATSDAGGGQREY
ncbi:hypothetical protein HQ520_11925 [bacterium]|nr:hypothetical protein [bacterium]